jgi:hypothetical protein
MRTKVNFLLEAVLSPFLTPGWSRKPAALTQILIIGFAAFAAAPSEAAQKPTGDTGGGTIYYLGPWAAQPGTTVLTMMNSDGSGKTTLGGRMFGNPSTALHNNHRWFIYTYVIPDQYYPDGITKRSEVYALRDDYSYLNNNNANTAVQLTDDITLQPKVGSPDWLPGDAQISFTARRWSSAQPGATVVGGGIYTAALVFGADGNIIGLDAQPAAPAIAFPLVEATPGDLWPELADYCWDPTGTLVAYAGYGNIDLWVANLLNQHTRIYIGSVYMPQWSPGGGKIAFAHGGIATINPDGTGFKLIIRNTATCSFFHAHWSPHESHIAYTGQYSNGSTANLDVFRATATGGSPVNLTGTSALNEYMSGGWR